MGLWTKSFFLFLHGGFGKMLGILPLFRSLNVEETSRILCTARPEVEVQGESYKHAATIDTLPEDVLLEIFYSYQTDDDLRSPLIPAPCRWLALVHVCRRWRQIVFESPLRLDLQLLCTYRTPVRKNLGFWPPFPIVIEHCHNQELLVTKIISLLPSNIPIV
ncbi:hypothetical protein EDB87DRAFT_1122394 [Lactarius vividus]|nr:hypothetical protein EDB87DRAFT_1122394 [Lactarius vividus]